MKPASFFKVGNHPSRPFLIASLMLLTAPLGWFEARAATKTWDGSSSGNWATGANWSGNTVPVAGDDLVFPTGATQLVTTNDFAVGTPFNSITISGTNYALRGNTILLTNGITHTSGGTNTVAAGIQLGQNQTFTATAASGRLILSSAVLPNGHDLFINADTGTIEITGAISTVGNVIKNGAGMLRLGGSGNNTYSGDTTVNQGLLELNKPAGTTAVPGPLIIGDGSGAASSAIVRMFASNQINDTSAVTIKADGMLDLNGFSDAIGALTLTGGDVSTGAGTLTLGGDVSANVGAGQANITGNLSLGSATRTFNVFGSLANNLYIPAQINGSSGFIKTGSGIMYLQGSNSFSGAVTVNDGQLLAYNSFALGTTNAGTVVQSNATLAVAAGAHVGLEPLTLNSSGAVFSSSFQAAAGGGSNSWAGNITLGRDTTIFVGTSATLNLSGTIGGSSNLIKTAPGTLRFSGTNTNTYSGVTTVAGGVLELGKTAGVAAVPGDLDIGVGGFATVHLLAANQIADSSDIYSTIDGTLELAGNNEDVASISGDGVIALSAGTLNLRAASGFYTYAGSILGSGGISKFGNSTLILTGTSSFTGTTSVIVGTLQVDGSQPFSPAFVNDNAHLQGTGTVGRIDMEGTGSVVSPGDSSGILTCSNFNTAGVVSSTLAIELNGTTPGIGYDQLNVRGSVNLTGMVLSASLNFASALSNQFVIINNDGAEAIIGTFTGRPQDSTLTIGGEQFRISYTGGTGNDVVLTQISGVFRPVLSIERIPPASVRLLWATNFTGFTLEANTNLNTNVWNVVTPTPVVSGTNNVVTNAITETQKFYRLFKP